MEDTTETALLDSVNSSTEMAQRDINSMESSSENLKEEYAIYMKELENGVMESTSESVKGSQEEELETEITDANSQEDAASTNQSPIKEEQAIEHPPMGMMIAQANTSDAEAQSTDNESKTKAKRKRKRSRPLKRIRKLKINKTTVKQEDERAVESEQSVDTSAEVSKEDVEYCLTVSNLPKTWSFMDIKNYIDTECGPVDEIEMLSDNKAGKGAIRLSYQTEEECKKSMEKLKDKEVMGNKLTLEINVVSLESDTEVTTETKQEIKKPWKPDLDSWDVDIHGTYGLKLPFLRTLGITPPLDKWVHVSNFRCDKTELRDVMEMAGNVQMCSVFTQASGPRYANVMYCHPLEAIQAVSMLNNQMFYGIPLKVAMDRSPSNTVLLPKGLTNIGKGLGLNGKPLRNIVKHYERFVENKDCLVNTAFFDIPENHSMKVGDDFDTKFVVKSVEDFKHPIATQVSKAVTTITVTSTVTPKPALNSKPKPVVQTPAFTMSPQPVPRPNFTQNFQRGPCPSNPAADFRAPFKPGPMNGQGPMMQQGPRPSPGPFPRPFQPAGPHPAWGPAQPMNNPCGPGPMGPGPMGPGPMGPGPMGPGPMGPGPMGPGPMGPGPMGPRPMGPGPMGAGPMGPGPMGPGPFANEPVKLVLSNLPPTTTFAILCEKMSEWGHVVCIQLTTPGCAVVTFANRMQADTCFQYYNGRNIDNYFIQVKYA